MWDEVAEGGWDENPSVQEYASHAAECFRNHVAPLLKPEWTLLDLGCGTGPLTRLLSPQCRSIVAIDPSDAMIKVCRAKAPANATVLRTVVDDAFVRDYSAAFDAVVASSVCAFVPDYPALLIHIKSLLKPHGLFFQLDWLKTNDDHGFTPDHVRNAYASCGGLETLFVLENAFHLTLNDENGTSTTRSVLACLCRRVS